MKRTAFQLLARINKALLPSYAKKDLSKLSKLQKALVGYRYWVTINSLPD